MIESIKRYRQNRDSINSANFDIKIHQTSEGESIDSIIDEIYPEIILSKQAQILKSSIQIMNKYNRDLDRFAFFLPNNKLKENIWLILPDENSFLYELIFFHDTINTSLIIETANIINNHFENLFNDDHIFLTFKQMIEKLGIVNTNAIIETSLSYNSLKDDIWFNQFIDELSENFEKLENFISKYSPPVKANQENLINVNSNSKEANTQASKIIEEIKNEYSANVVRGLREGLTAEIGSRKEKLYTAIKELDSSIREYSKEFQSEKQKYNSIKKGTQNVSKMHSNRLQLAALKVKIMHKNLQNIVGENTLNKIHKYSLSNENKKLKGISKIKTNLKKAAFKDLNGINNTNKILKNIRKNGPPKTFTISISSISANLTSLKYLKFLDKVFLITNLADRIDNVDSAYKISKRAGEEKLFEETCGFGAYWVGGTLGGKMGAITGAAIGAKLGFLLGPPGIIIGFFAGGIIGSVAFSILADYEAKKRCSYIYNYVNPDKNNSLKILEPLYVEIK
ncbi:hypothetical protein GCL60_06805 [Silvanigrella paludirubra]|uniref:Uncharacterized protein n=1 Tax=Silvanigrella paludirubra TaxID=2499159 RepID=A0A6N6VYK6_9BACT|nr:DUF456 domain-containing protein [Silvanigrella paludirubra]KAB8039966.1 hypothetical protein GCL60_06805 [Silvanigrella paludirubra]